jgi:formylglycine-generating enzyme required for sulfatase activity
MAVSFILRLSLALAVAALHSCSREPATSERPAATPAARATATTSAPQAKGEDRPNMVFVPAGEFLMGSAADDTRVYEWERKNEQPQHPVYTDAYYIDRTEVTNAQYEKHDPSHQRDANSPCDDCPVTRVTWFQAKAYCEAQHKRLPTEAEWEKAAKAGTDGYPEPFEEYVWFAKNTIKRTQPVGTKKPNAWGLHDMLGNVREWTADWYGPYYYHERVRDNPKGPPEGKRRSERGGAFFLPKRGVTTTIRYNHPPTFRLYFLGFRCAQDP